MYKRFYSMPAASLTNSGKTRKLQVKADWTYQRPRASQTIVLYVFRVPHSCLVDALLPALIKFTTVQDNFTPVHKRGVDGANGRASSGRGAPKVLPQGIAKGGGVRSVFLSGPAAVQPDGPGVQVGLFKHTGASPGQRGGSLYHTL